MEPLNLGAMLSGTNSVTRSITSTSHSSGHAQSRHLSASNFAATMNAMAPMTAPDPWLARKYQLDRPFPVATIALAL